MRQLIQSLTFATGLTFSPGAEAENPTDLTPVVEQLNESPSTPQEIAETTAVASAQVRLANLCAEKQISCEVLETHTYKPGDGGAFQTAFNFIKGRDSNTELEAGKVRIIVVLKVEARRNEAPSKVHREGIFFAFEGNNNIIGFAE